MRATMSATMSPSSIMTGNWWAVALRAAAAILLGIIALVSPIGTLATLVTVFGFYAIADGVLAIVVAVRGIRTHDHWGWMFVAGIIGIAARDCRHSQPGDWCAGLHVARRGLGIDDGCV